MYSSSISMGVSSSIWPLIKRWSLHILISISSAVFDGSCFKNHGGLLREQQVLGGPQPAPSHRESSVYTV